MRCLNRLISDGGQFRRRWKQITNHNAAWNQRNRDMSPRMDPVSRIVCQTYLPKCSLAVPTGPGWQWICNRHVRRHDKFIDNSPGSVITYFRCKLIFHICSIWPKIMCDSATWCPWPLLRWASVSGSLLRERQDMHRLMMRQSMTRILYLVVASSACDKWCDNVWWCDNRWREYFIWLSHHQPVTNDATMSDDATIDDENTLFGFIL